MAREKLSKLYRRGRFKQGLERRLGGKKISENTDILMYLNFLIFLKKLAEATEVDVQEKRSKKIKESDIQNNIEKTLRQFRG